MKLWMPGDAPDRSALADAVGAELRGCAQTALRSLDIHRPAHISDEEWREMLRGYFGFDEPHVRAARGRG